MLRDGAQREMNALEAGCSYRTAAPGAEAPRSGKDPFNWGVLPFLATSWHPTNPWLN